MADAVGGLNRIDLSLNRRKKEVFSGRNELMGRKVKYILAIVCAITAAVGAAIFAVLMKKKLENGVTVSGGANVTLTAESTKSIEANIGGLYPGERREYVIDVKLDQAENSEIVIAFRDKDTNGKLKNYIGVTVTSGDTSVEKSLKELLEGSEELRFDGSTTQIVIVYTMRQDAGNESQGATADFYIDISAKTAQNSNADNAENNENTGNTENDGNVAKTE